MAELGEQSRDLACSTSPASKNPKSPHLHAPSTVERQIGAVASVTNHRLLLDSGWPLASSYLSPLGFNVIPFTPLLSRQILILLLLSSWLLGANLIPSALKPENLAIAEALADLKAPHGSDCPRAGVMEEARHRRKGDITCLLPLRPTSFIFIMLLKMLFCLREKPILPKD